MQWLPPSFRVIYSSKLNDVDFVYSKLDEYIKNLCLICVMDTDRVNPVANITFMRKEKDRLYFWMYEKKPNYFLNNKIHLESYEACVQFDDDNDSISNILILKRKEKEDAVNIKTDN